MIRKRERYVSQSVYKVVQNRMNQKNDIKQLKDILLQLRDKTINKEEDEKKRKSEKEK